MVIETLVVGIEHRVHSGYISLLWLMVIETVERCLTELPTPQRYISLLWLMVIETMRRSPSTTATLTSYISLLWLMVIETHPHCSGGAAVDRLHQLQTADGH